MNNFFFYSLLNNILIKTKKSARNKKMSELKKFN